MKGNERCAPPQLVTHACSGCCWMRVNQCWCGGWKHSAAHRRATCCCSPRAAWLTFKTTSSRNDIHKERLAASATHEGATHKVRLGKWAQVIMNGCYLSENTDVFNVKGNKTGEEHWNVWTNRIRCQDNTNWEIITPRQVVNGTHTSSRRTAT